MTEEEIKRINFLAKKARESGLSDEERAEQALLRRRYIDSVVGSLKTQLDHTKIVEPDGTVHAVKQKSSPPKD